MFLNSQRTLHCFIDKTHLLINSQMLFFYMFNLWSGRIVMVGWPCSWLDPLADGMDRIGLVPDAGVCSLSGGHCMN